MGIKNAASQMLNKYLDEANQSYFEKHKKDYSIKDYKGMYKGQDCFVVGNGPSLSTSDLDRIHKLHFISFASNKIYNILPSTRWQPTYVTVSDPQFIRNRTILQRIEAVNPSMLFVRSQFARDVKKLTCSICSVNTDASRELLDNPRFSMQCDEIIYDIATVTYFSLQLAAYMGFKKIYLIGMDNRYAYSRLKDGTIIKNEGVASYFSEMGQELPSPSKAASVWEMDVAYEYAEKYSREHGFRIFNATRGGFLEKFERVDLDEILESRAKDE